MEDDISKVARSLGQSLAKVKRKIDRRIGKTGRPQIVPYRGYGNDAEVFITARVMLDPGLSRATANDLWFRNLLNTYKRAESDELPGAIVSVEGVGSRIEVQANEEGYIHAVLPIAQKTDELWQTITFKLISPVAPDGTEITSTGYVIVPSENAQFGVISDLDDTVIRTDVNNMVRMLRAVAFANAHTRLPFHGVAAFYRALHYGTAGIPTNPIFYVSSSPWNLYDLLEEFMDVRGIPPGPMVLRDWGLSMNPSSNGPHKVEAIRKIIDSYPELPFILIGDSGQEDPEIYREIISHYPDRIRAAYIRNVTPGPEDVAKIKKLIDEVAESGATMVLTDDTLAAARHALEQGWINPEAIKAIVADEVMEDKKDPDPEPEPDAGPTIVVEGEDAPSAEAREARIEDRGISG